MKKILQKFSIYDLNGARRVYFGEIARGISFQEDFSKCYQFIVFRPILFSVYNGYVVELYNSVYGIYLLNCMYLWIIV